MGVETLNVIKQELVIFLIDGRVVHASMVNGIELLRLKSAIRLPGTKMTFTSPNGNTTSVDIKDVRYDYYDF